MSRRQTANAQMLQPHRQVFRRGSGVVGDKQKWRADIKGWGDSPKASDGQNVYLTVHNLYLKAIEKDTGKLVWSKDHEGLGGRPSQRLAGPVLHHGLLWITDYGTLCGINPKSGKTVQELKIDTKNSYHLPPVVHQDRIYLINEDGLVAIDLK